MSFIWLGFKFIFMKKNFLLIFFLFLLNCLVGCSQQKNKDLKTLVVGTNATYPPYEFIDETGEVIGFDIDLAYALAEKLGKKADIREFSFDALILNLQKNKIDCILAGVFITPEREEKIAMIPYFGEQVTELGLLFWNKIPPCPYDFSKYKFIAVQTGTVQEKFVCSLDSVKIKSVESITDLVMELKYNKSDVVVVGPDLIGPLKKQFPELCVVMHPLPESWKVFGNGIGINKKNTALIKEVDKAILELKEEGVIDSLEKKWFGE